MNVLELIKKLGPKADAKKIWVVTREVADNVLYVMGEGGYSNEAWDAEGFETLAEAEVVRLVAEVNTSTELPLPIYKKVTLSELGLRLQWGFEFIGDGTKFRPSISLSDTGISWSEMISTAKQAAKDELRESRNEVRDAETVLHNAKGAFKQAEAATKKLLANIDKANGKKKKKPTPKTKPKKKKKPAPKTTARRKR